MKVLPDGSRRTYEGMETECDRLTAIIRKGHAVVEDFMPNIGGCVLQNYQRLNEFLIEAQRVIWDADAEGCRVPPPIEAGAAARAESTADPSPMPENSTGS